MKDPIVEEVRKHRMEHTNRFDGDLHRICEDLRKTEKGLSDRVVKRSPRKLTDHAPLFRVAEEPSEYRVED
ncbi:hypothetical protein PDESU_06037 [Pontiella desulfatans]|uniref:Uncharacterized protein n=1 Tax=Pontiella desulfatans TaxID=2750659 RepID=A0A6C2UDE7_PONDE|nr:hypothetical protein [Pontiella desulfatans]VGO17441.1 hypothetical protein PDESU_06037 [Pontiella desulfatans]